MDYLLLYRPGAGNAWILSHGAGNSFVAQFASSSGIGGFDLSSTADNIIAFDYNGTGLMDHLVLYRPGAGTVWILEHGSGNSFDAVEAGSGIGYYDLSSPADRLIAYDYSGAGLLNYLLAYRPGTGIVWVLGHGGGNSFAPQFASSSGLGGYDLLSTVDQIISFDFASNGTQPNLLAYRPGSGEAFVLQPSSGSFTAVYEAPNLPTLTLTNLTNPSWGSNFAVGDTFQVTIASGMPYQQVSVAGSSSGNLVVGQTDGNGSFTYTEVENSSQIGSYTEVWTVGQYTVSPSVSFLVGQLGNPGTISTTAMGQTSDSDITGVSTLSITNGVVSTYSATELDYTASLYYDSQTVATLFDDGAQVAQTSAYTYGGSSSANLTANATAWDDYDLQTDHYAVAYFVSGGYYENPFYYDGGGSCFDDSGDCIFGSGGEYDYYVSVATIYLGSTVVHQTDVPQDGTTALVDDSGYDGFFQSAPQPVPSGPILSVDSWNASLARIAKLLFNARGAWASQNPNNPYIYPLPYLMVLISDTQYPVTGNDVAERDRTYLLEDTYGHPWTNNNPVTVAENFVYVGGVQSEMPAPNNPSTAGIAPWSYPKELSGGRFTDAYGFQKPGKQPLWYLQFYWAWGFTAPSVFTLPTLPGVNDGSISAMSGARAIPLMIKTKNPETAFQNCAPFGSQGVFLTQQYIGINGEASPAKPPGCSPDLGVF